MTTDTTQPSRIKTPAGEAASQSEAAPRQGKGRPLIARIVAGALVLLLGWHFLLTFTWNAAPNAIRQIVGSDIMTAYMMPMFIQGWAVFAPNPGASNVDFQVRALLPGVDGGEDVATEWFSVTDSDHAAAILAHAVPSRLYLTNYILADRFHGSFLRMKAEVRELAGQNYLGKDWPAKLEADLLAGLGVQSNPTVSEYMDYERTVTGLATAIARARWGNDLAGLQVKVLTTPVVPFDQRNDPAATTQTTYFMEGWRAPLDVPGLDASVIDARYGKEAGR